jgi:hypothetical protein
MSDLSCGAKSTRCHDGEEWTYTCKLDVHVVETEDGHLALLSDHEFVLDPEQSPPPLVLCNLVADETGKVNCTTHREEASEADPSHCRGWASYLAADEAAHGVRE